MSSSIQAGASKMGPSKRKGKGRQKVSMMKMQNESNLQVTFSKRRAGLFKKASELFTLCGVEGAIIAFSPGNKVYSFGHPNVETIKDRLVNGVPPTPIGGKSINQIVADAQRNCNIYTLNMELMELEGMLDTEKKRGEELDRIKKDGQKKSLFPPPIEEFNRDGLVALNETVKNFKEDIDKHVTELSLLINQSGYGREGGMNIKNSYQAPNAPYLAMASNNNVNAIASYELFRPNRTHIPFNHNEFNEDPYRLMSGGSSSGIHIEGGGVSTSAASPMLPNGPHNNVAGGEFYGFNNYGANF